MWKQNIAGDGYGYDYLFFAVNDRVWSEHCRKTLVIIPNKVSLLFGTLPTSYNYQSVLLLLWFLYFVCFSRQIKILPTMDREIPLNFTFTETNQNVCVNQNGCLSLSIHTSFSCA